MKTIVIGQAVEMIPHGASVMIGGFMGVGTPERVVDEMVRQGKRDLTVIANDTASPGVGIGKLVNAKALRKVIASHIGLNPETQRQMIAGELEVELVPQGTLIERIRAGGFGLGGVLTPTGVGTIVEENKQRLEVNGKKYLVETALRADFALASDEGDALLEKEYILRVVFSLHSAQLVAVGTVVLTLPIRGGGVWHVDVSAVPKRTQCAPEVGRPAQSLRVQRRIVPCGARLAVEQRIAMGERGPSGRSMPHSAAKAQTEEIARRAGRVGHEADDEVNCFVGERLLDELGIKFPERENGCSVDILVNGRPRIVHIGHIGLAYCQH
jgi:acetate CoA/acetoacetate CoA-transferase alpha subunit